MRTRIICSVATAALLLGACGSGSNNAHTEVVDQLMESADAAGLVLDRSCVEDIAAQLSDDDSKRIIEAGPDEQPVLSDEGEALGTDLFGCVSTDSLVDSIITDMGDENVDVECMKDALKGLDTATLAAGDLPDGIFECIKTGG
jgi:hypothetical protein